MAQGALGSSSHARKATRRNKKMSPPARSAGAKFKKLRPLQRPAEGLK